MAINLHKKAKIYYIRLSVCPDVQMSRCLSVIRSAFEYKVLWSFVTLINNGVTQDWREMIATFKNVWRFISGQITLLWLYSIISFSRVKVVRLIFLPWATVYKARGRRGIICQWVNEGIIMILLCDIYI